MDLQNLIQQANQRGVKSEQELYRVIIEIVINESLLGSILISKKDIQRHLRDAKKKATEKSDKTEKTKPVASTAVVLPEVFESLMQQQRQLLGSKDVEDLVILLTALKLLEDAGEDSNYKDVLREIMIGKLHKLTPEPLNSIIIEREKELSDISRILQRSSRNSVIIVGPTGSGKSMLSRAALEQVVDVPVFRLYPGNSGFYDHLLNILAATSNKKPTFFLDDCFSFTPDQLAYVVENAQVVATGNESSYKKFVVDHPAIIAKFETMHIEEPKEEPMKKISAFHQEKLSAEHGLAWEDDFSSEIYALAKRFIPDIAFPAKAITLIEEAAIYAQHQQSTRVTKDIVKTIISQKTKIPMSDLSELDKKDLSSLPDKLKATVKGQDHAIEKVSGVVQRSKLGFGKKNRPIGSFLFVGPSGVGKTELAKAVAHTLFGNEENMVRLDMSEFAESHNVQRLIGAPPGYIGFEDGGQLTNPIKAKPYNLVLLDEIEKAHPRVFDIFLQVLDDGRLTDGQGKLVDFRNTVIIATSNAGIEDMLDLIEEGKTTAEIEKEIKEILQDYFRIEFINRFDGVILFNALVPEALEEIARLQIIKLQKDLEKHNISLTVTDESLKKIAQASYDPRYGARGLLRFIQESIEDKLAEMIIQGQVSENQKIVF